MRARRLLPALLALVLACSAPAGPEVVVVGPEGLAVTREGPGHPVTVAWDDVAEVSAGSTTLGEYSFEQLHVSTRERGRVLVCTTGFTKPLSGQSFVGASYGDVRVSRGDFDRIRELLEKGVAGERPADAQRFHRSGS